MSFRFSKRSLQRLQGVHADLVAVATEALARTPIDFAITEGLRTAARQKALVAAKASRTLDSRHLTGHAIDVVAYVGAQVRWEFNLYVQIAYAFRDASAATGIPVRWGGAWVLLTPRIELAAAVARYVARCRDEGRDPLLDGAHFELPTAQYPA